jgi:hypothetical protein
MDRQRAGRLGGGGVFGHAIGDGPLGQDHLAAEQAHAAQLFFLGDGFRHVDLRGMPSSVAA